MDPSVEEALLEYISKYEKKYLIDLFGFDLYELFIADLVDGTPTSERFLDVYNVLYYNPVGNVFIPIDAAYTGWASQFKNCKKEPTYSEGISTMLKGFVFFHFVRDMDLNVSSTGVVVNKNENSDRADAKTLEFIELRFNEAVDSFKVIRNYMIGNSSTYPEYDGVNHDKVNWGGAF